jgi:hypothetical protein
MLLTANTPVAWAMDRRSGEDQQITFFVTGTMTNPVLIDVAPADNPTGFAQAATIAAVGVTTVKVNGPVMLRYTQVAGPAVVYAQ